MIAHLILFRPKEDLPDASQHALLASLDAAASSIPGIRRFRVGRRVRHGLPGYEQAMREDFTFMVLIEVDDMAALTSYLTHPAHAAFGAHFTQSSSAALAYDYEVVDASSAASLI